MHQGKYLFFLYPNDSAVGICSSLMEPLLVWVISRKFLVLPQFGKKVHDSFTDKKGLPSGDPDFT